MSASICCCPTQPDLRQADDLAALAECPLATDEEAARYRMRAERIAGLRMSGPRLYVDEAYWTDADIERHAAARGAL